jgi:hypothetical protein
MNSARLASCALVWLIAAAGCPRSRIPDGGLDESFDDDPSEPARCGVGDEHMTEYRVVPTTAVVAASIDLGSPELDGALEQLRTHSTTAALPVRAAFSFGQWSWQVPLLRDSLGRHGLQTGELVAIALDDGLGGWVAPLGCTQDEAIVSVRERGAKVEDAGTIAVVAAVPDETAWDLVLGPGSIVTLAPAGRGREFAARLAARSDASATAGPSPGDRLAALADAPVRIVVMGHGFTTGGTLSPPGARALRASADAVNDVALESP